MEYNKKEILIGIDLGITNSIVAINRNGNAKMISISENEIGKYIISSMVCLK